MTPVRSQTRAVVAPEPPRPGAARGVSRALVLGFPLDAISLEECCIAIDRAIADRRRAVIVTANVHYMMRARSDASFRAWVEAADLVVADGVPLVWVASLAGHPVRGRVNGTDLVDACARWSARRGWRIGLLGGLPGAAEQAAARLRERWPGCAVEVVDAAPGIPGGPDPARAAAARERRIDLLLVALGVPKQDAWLAANLAGSGATVGIAIGSALDQLSGLRRRAPRWMQRAGLEWLFRMAQEPRRLGRRYLAENTRFLLLAAATLLRGRR